MKKIDLHIHTIPVANKDADFNFDITKFQDYVDGLSIDAVAITNHNLFNLEQFNEITKTLQNVIVLPGIEIDFEGGHLLLIEESDNLGDFNQKCEAVKNEFENSSQVNIKRLREIFVDLDKYLIIPHYDKKPNVSSSTIESLKPHVFVGEVQSPKKFNRVIKESESLIPILFSDARISVNLDIDQYQGNQTFINTNSNPLSIDTIKAALADRNKVFLNNAGRKGFFQIFGEGQELSYGLNIILGQRSSGKTHLLNQLKNSFDKGEKSIKYIEQFELVKNDAEKFNKIIENEKSLIREIYLHEFKTVVDDVCDIDRSKTCYNIKRYIESLLEFASNKKLHDEFSNAKLYTETIFQLRDNSDLEKLIGTVILLKDNDVYKSTINKHLSEINLKNLLDDLESIYKEKSEKKIKKEWVNGLVRNIKGKLEHNTSSPKIEDDEVDFYKMKVETESVKRFNAIARTLKEEKIIDENKSFDKFKIQAVASKYNSAGEIKEESRVKTAFSPAFIKYNKPIEFLEKLERMQELEKSELYKYFCRVTYRVLNEYDKDISGGERAEFNLLKALQDARQYEMLLIDEPESSFDNPFLKDSVNKEIKNISKKLPVVVVTHNNTVAMLLQPDYIIYAKREIVGGTDVYKLFSGSPADKEFKTVDGGEAVVSYDVLLSTLEAGETAYNTRRDLYNKFKKY